MKEQDLAAKMPLPLTYQIEVEGHLAPIWAAEFEGFAITLLENGTTCLTGAVIDQAALHGLLRKIRDLGLPLVSVTCLKNQ